MTVELIVFIALCMICAQAGLVVMLVTEIRAFRAMNEGLGMVALEYERAGHQLVAAIIEKANADQPQAKGTSH